MITSPTMMGQLKDLVQNNVYRVTGAGAPTNGTSGTGVGITGPGSTYIDTTNNNEYFNIGSITSPLWFSINVGVVKTVRTRNTVAEVNAGATLLPALAGYKYRLVDAYAISVGGAAGAVTTVDIIGTVSTARKLVAFAQASLTQSTLLRAGSSGGAILADGASFTANDTNTAITIGVTGSAVTTATHIDSVLQYVIEKA